MSFTGHFLLDEDSEVEYKYDEKNNLYYSLTDNLYTQAMIKRYPQAQFVLDGSSKLFSGDNWPFIANALERYKLHIITSGSTLSTDWSMNDIFFAGNLFFV